MPLWDKGARKRPVWVSLRTEDFVPRMSNSSERDKLQKLYFRIGEVATIVGVEPHVLRYWEGEFRSVRPQKSARGQRIYSRRDVETLLKVKELLYAHRFTIAGARRRLRDGGPDLSVPEPDAATPSSAPAAAPALEAASLPTQVAARLADGGGVEIAAVAAPPPGIAVEELQAVYDRLVVVRNRARALLTQVDDWGNDPKAP